MTIPQEQARRELQLFGLGLMVGGAFLILSLGVLGFSGILLFVWVAARVPHALIVAFVVDAVLHKRPKGGARALPFTAFTAGVVAPVAAVSLRYLF